MKQDYFNKTGRSIFFGGAVIYLLLGLMAFVYFKERVAFVDLSFHLFEIVKDGDFAIQNHRFGAAFTQLFPLVAMKLGCSLETLMKVYSLSFIVYYFALFSACSLLLKKHKFALSLLLFNTLMVLHTFYWAQSEFPQGLSFMVFYFAFMSWGMEEGRSSKWWYWVMNILFVTTLAFFHPLLVIPFFFATAYFTYFKHISRKYLLVNAVLFLIFYSVKKYGFPSEYESNAMSGTDNIKALFPNYLDQLSFDSFWTYLIQDYYLFFPILFLIIYAFVKDRKMLPLVAVLGTSIAYVFLINISFPNGGMHFYMENLYLPLSLFLIIPLIFDVMPSIHKSIFLPIILVFCLVKVGHIWMTHQPYTARVEYLQNLIQETAKKKRKKVIRPTKSMDEEVLMMCWANVYEVWLLSTIETGNTTSLLVIDKPLKYHWAQGGKYNKKFITDWGLFNYDDLPEQYFQFRDTSDYLIKQ